jgi:hypothetical protein
MIRSTVSKLMWVGRATVFLVGLSVILALVFGLAAVAFAANGDPWLLGRSNAATAITRLTANIANPALQLVNTSTSAGATALRLQTASSRPPMTLNSSQKVANLNADQLDGNDSSAFAPLSGFGAAQVLNGAGGPLPWESTYTSQGGTLIISASGSGYRGTGSSQKEGRIGMLVIVDGTARGPAATVYTNERNSHKAFIPSVIVVEGLPAGVHTIRLERLYNPVCNTASESPEHFCTATDFNDAFNVTVMELPD